MVQTVKTEHETLVQDPFFIAWQQEHPDAYLASAFLSIETKHNPWSIDYYCPNEQIMHSFIVKDKEIDHKKNEIVFKQEQKKPEALVLSSFEAPIQEVVSRIKDTHAKGKNINRVMVALQCINGQSLYQMTLFTDQFLIIHAKVDAGTGDILSVQIHNLMQFASMHPGSAQ